MFGYVTVGKGQLTEEEYEIFRAYYCGVCRSIGKCASQTARMGLSYDITFLALVLSSVASDEPKKPCGRCLPHPKKRRAFVADDAPTDYAAAMGVLLDFLKLEDDWHDEHSIKALLLMAIFRRGYVRVKRRYQKQYELIKRKLNRLSGLEADGCAVIDEAADAFARILEALFTPDFISDKAQRRTLAWLGYNLGRWIYVIDAFNDFDADMKSGAYNALIASGKTDRRECADAIRISLTVTLSNIASAYELLSFKHNREIVGKMIYISLKEKQEYILAGKAKGEKGLIDESV